MSVNIASIAIFLVVRDRNVSQDKLVVRKRAHDVIKIWGISAQRKSIVIALY